MSLPPLNPALFHLDSDHLWLMHCAEGPVSRSVARLVRSFLHKELWPWEMDWQEDFLGVPEALRMEAARLVAIAPSSRTISLSNARMRLSRSPSRVSCSCSMRRTAICSRSAVKCVCCALARPRW